VSLFDKLEQESHALKSRGAGQINCRTCQWLKTLGDGDRVAASIEQWYADELPHLNLYRILRDNGFPVSETSLRRHRDHLSEELEGGHHVD
jgi:hypothetical protein